MDILVVHPSLNERGGAERVTLAIIESIKEKGYKVALGTFEKPNWKEINDFFGDKYKPDAEFIHKRIFGRSAYGELLNFHFLLSHIPLKYETVIISTTSPWFYCPTADKVIIYFNCSPINHKYGLKRAYLSFYNFIQSRFLKKAKNKIILTNSSFSSEALKSIYSLEPKVIYPPVNLDKFCPFSKKEDLIVSVGRFVPNKKYEILIKAFSKVNNGKCIIIGSVKNKTSLKYLKRIKKLINYLKLNHKINLITNCPYSILQGILSRAKIYVHCAPSEYFGISVVEAMASGCVPIVYQSGGPYTDIINYGEYGFSFKKIYELTSKINLLLNNDHLYKEFKEKAIQRSKTFDARIFKKEIIEIIES
ncbi:MAG: hypothetical protein DRI74_07575 [Bacteroidetes bacterium]|nr:MAG: hypothetical protein DRI74_07575 [Bacteroidota bacterium]